jgi:hypothetical protein
LDIPGSVLVPLDNKPVQIASMILKVINPLAWVLSPIDRKFLTPWARTALAPLTAIVADLPSSEDRDKDARAWRQVLSYAPAKITTVITRMIIADLAARCGIGRLWPCFLRSASGVGALATPVLSRMKTL